MPESDNRTKEDEPESDYPGLGFRIVGKSDCISNTDALNNKDFYKGNVNTSKKKQQQHDYKVIPESSTRYDVKTLINEEIFGSN